jgi:hypothetical protein
MKVDHSDAASRYYATVLKRNHLVPGTKCTGAFPTLLQQLLPNYAAFPRGSLHTSINRITWEPVRLRKLYSYTCIQSGQCSVTPRSGVQCKRLAAASCCMHVIGCTCCRRTALSGKTNGSEEPRRTIAFPPSKIPIQHLD